MSVSTRLDPLLSAGEPRQLLTVLPPADATIPVGDSPLGVTLTPDGARAYVANRASNSVSVIDTATNTVTATIAAAGGPTLLAFSPDGTRAYLTLSDAGALGVIDTATNTVTTTIAVGAGAVGVAVTPNGAHAYVTSQNANTLSVVDTATNTVIATVNTGPAPIGVAISPDGTRAYVCTVGDSTVSVVDTATNTVTGSFTAGDVPVFTAFSPDGTRAYVCNAGGDSVSVVDTATITVIATIGVGTLPRFVAVSPDGTAAYTADFTDNAVSVIDTATNTVTGSIPVGNGPVCVAVTPAGNRLYVTDNADNAVIVIALTLVPSQGTTVGGTIVTIRGHNLAGATAVRFGNSPATILANTATSVTVRAPAGQGAVPVTVTTPGGTGTFGTFYYLPAPLLTGITTTMGPVTGGGTAVITGANLAGTTSVRFGSRVAPIQSVTDTTVTVGIPGAPSSGPVPVTVVTPVGNANGLTFTYLDAPSLTAVNPASGPTGGGIDVTITGANLATTQEVTFDNTPAAFAVISDQTITATAPPHPAGGSPSRSAPSAAAPGAPTPTSTAPPSDPRRRPDHRHRRCGPPPQSTSGRRTPPGRHGLSRCRTVRAGRVPRRRVAARRPSSGAGRGSLAYLFELGGVQLGALGDQALAQLGLLRGEWFAGAADAHSHRAPGQVIVCRGVELGLLGLGERPIHRGHRGVLASDLGRPRRQHPGCLPRNPRLSKPERARAQAAFDRATRIVADIDAVGHPDEEPRS